MEDQRLAVHRTIVVVDVEGFGDQRRTKEVAFPGAGVQLCGSITCPDAADACPGVVLIGGSGPSDRHNGGFFDALRTHLASTGVAVLAYDKRGAGKSTGAWAAATVDDLAHDAAAAVAALRSHPRVADDAVGVLGHSEGGWVALRLCTQAGHPAASDREFLPGGVVRRIGGVRPHHGGCRAGRGGNVDAAAGRSRAGGPRLPAGAADHRRLPARTLVALLSASGFTLDRATWAQLTAWADYDPCDDLPRLKTPTLAIFGENDPLVPVHASIERYQETAAHATRYQQTLVFPGADHRLQTTAGFAPGFLTQLSRWCRDQKRRRCPGSHGQPIKCQTIRVLRPLT